MIRDDFFSFFNAITIVLHFKTFTVQPLISPRRVSPPPPLQLVKFCPALAVLQRGEGPGRQSSLLHRLHQRLLWLEEALGGPHVVGAPMDGDAFVRLE